jgi:hypothetical protein
MGKKEWRKDIQYVAYGKEIWPEYKLIHEITRG